MSIASDIQGLDALIRKTIPTPCRTEDRTHIAFMLSDSRCSLCDVIISPADAIRLRDWLTKNYDEVKK